MDKIERIIVAKYLAHCPAQAAVDWLRERKVHPSVYGNRPFISADEYADDLERILLARNDEYINVSLARYGHSRDVADRLHARADLPTKLTLRAHHIVGASFDCFAVEQFDDDLFLELMATFKNKHVENETLVLFFDRGGIFQRLTESQYVQALVTLGRNPRLSTPYGSTYMDGFDDYQYHQVFDKAWEVLFWAPTTQLWASGINNLLSRAHPPKPSFDVMAAIQRWTIDEPNTGDRLYFQSSSWFLRSRIADLLPADVQLSQSEDDTLRQSFYRRFLPAQFPEWPNFFDQDRNEFLSAALENENLWMNAGQRWTLGRLVWAADDPRSDMEYPNSYRSMEQKFRELHPEWFADEEAEPA